MMTLRDFHRSVSHVCFDCEDIGERSNERDSELKE